jgi:hypothetical protein
LFYKELKRFPYSYDEWYGFEQHQIAHDEVANKMLENQRNLMLEEMTRPPIDPEAQKLALKLILEKTS